MGRRSRRRAAPAYAGDLPRTEDDEEPQSPEAMRRGYARSEARNEEVRRTLEPLAPGERPGAVTVAAVVAVLLAVAVVVGALTGNDLAQDGGSLAGGALIAGVLLLAAAGMWRAKYWAVLGFQAFLTFQVIVACLALVRASSLYGVAICLVLIGGGGLLFWKLVRAMARIQMPERRPRQIS